MKIDANLRSLVASQLLGDGSAHSYPAISIKHSLKQLEYLEWKRYLFTKAGADTTDIVVRHNRQSTFGLQNIAWFSIKQILNKVNLDSKDPIDCIESLDELGLLLWWLDDGSLTVHTKKSGTSVSRFGYLCTEAFDFEMNKEISDAIHRRFGISTKIHIDRGGVGYENRNKIFYRLYLSATEMRRLIDTVRNFISEIPDSMLYKLNMDYRPNRHPDSEYFSKRYNF